MMKHKYLRIRGGNPCVAVFVLILAIGVSFPVLSWGGPKRSYRDARFHNAPTYDQNMRQRYRDGFNRPDRHGAYAPLHRRGAHPLLSKNYKKRYDRMSPEEKTRLKRRYQEWESLPEEKRQKLRRRMKKYEQLPPQERERFKQRHRQLKKLPPNERHIIREKLRKWDDLSPQEQEQVRQRFRRP